MQNAIIWMQFMMLAFAVGNLYGVALTLVAFFAITWPKKFADAIWLFALGVWKAPGAAYSCIMKAIRALIAIQRMALDILGHLIVITYTLGSWCAAAGKFMDDAYSCCAALGQPETSTTGRDERGQEEKALGRCVIVTQGMCVSAL